MLASDLAWTAITSATTGALVGAPIAVLAAVGLALAGRRQPRVEAIAAILIGSVLGFSLLTAEREPAIRVLAILAVVGVGVVLAVAGRLSVAGGVLIAAALPATAFAGATLFDGAIGARRIDLVEVVPPFLAGLVGVAIGISLIRFQQTYLARHPELAAQSPTGSNGGGAAGPPARRWDAASRAALGPSIGGLNLAAIASVIALIAGTQITVVAAHGRPVLEVLALVALGSIATGLAAALVWAVAWPPVDRRAFEAFAWLGESEFERFRVLTDGRLAPTIGNMKRHVRNTPERAEDRWIRVEVHAASGQLDEAREIALRLPVDTPVERAEQAVYLEYLDWLAGGPDNPAGAETVRDAVAAILPADGDDRLRAEVSLAIAEVRRRIGSGAADPSAPLREVRARLGRRADGVLFAAARRQLGGFVRIATVFIVLIAVLDRAFGG
jgi:hypothetical protein